MKKMFGLLLLVVSLNSVATTKNTCLESYRIKADKRNQIYTAAGTVGIYAITVPLVTSMSIVSPLAFVTFTYAGLWWANNPDQFYIANQYKQIERALIAAQKKDYKNKDFQKLALKVNKISSKKYSRQSSDEKIAQLLTQASHERAICPDIKIDRQNIKFVLNKNDLAKYIAAKSQESQLIIEPGQFEYLTLPEADQNEITRITQEMTLADDKKNPFCSNNVAPEVKVSISHGRRENEILQTTSSISYRCQESSEWKYAQSCEYRQDEQTNKWEVEYCDT
jgi:hypothetical protein